MFGAPSLSRSALAVVAGAASLTLLWGGVSSAGSESFDECVRRKTAAGTDRAVATAQCATSTNGGQTSVPSGGGDDGGTSVVALLLAGVVGAAVGAGAVVLQRRQRGATGTAPGGAAAGMPPAGMPPGGFPPAGMPPPNSMPAPGQAPAADPRTDALVNALIDLGDRVNSGALRAEIVATLAAAGVQALEPPVGTPFDAARMRGVGSAPAPSPQAVGTVAGTDRVGYATNGRVLRLPDVVVYTAP